MPIQLLHDRVAVRRNEMAKLSDGGIDMSAAADEDQPAQGEVVAVGPGTYKDNGTFIPTVVKVGDTVTFGKMSGTKMQLDGEELWTMFEADIVAVVK